VRKLEIAIAQYRYILASQSAAMDSSRKRKATNATPSQTDGSATKKIKLVVRVLLVYTLFLDIDRVTRSRVDGQRIGVCAGGGAGCVMVLRERRQVRREDARESMGGIGL
jgi:hypothetical protein